MKTSMGILINYMRANFHLTNETEEEFIKALAAERHQIIDAYMAGQVDFDDDKDAIEYYNDIIK